MIKKKIFYLNFKLIKYERLTKKKMLDRIIALHNEKFKRPNSTL